MIVYHCIGANKLKRRLKGNRCLPPPVRAWKKIESAERFSKQTGRQIILRLKFPDDERTKHLEGHRGEAVYVDRFVPLLMFGNNSLR